MEVPSPQVELDLLDVLAPHLELTTPAAVWAVVLGLHCGVLHAAAAAAANEQEEGSETHG